jgi:hypothetical protein
VRSISLPVVLSAVVGGLALWPAPSLAAGEKPEVTTRVASQVTTTSATIEAGINPEGSQTSYEISLECQSAAGGESCEPLTVGAQLQQGTIAAGLGETVVSAPMTGLQPGYLYKYDVIATNAAGREGYVGSSFLTCPASGQCRSQPVPGGESLSNIEGARREGEEAPRLEAEREARHREEEARPAKEAAEKAAHDREVREAGERTGREAAERSAREAAERTAALRRQRCAVPRLRGDSLAAARRALHRVHCNLGKVTEPRSRHGALIVTRQSVRAGRILAGGAKVEVTLAPKHG